MPKKMRRRKPLDVWKDIAEFNVGDMVRLKINHEVRGEVIKVDFGPVFDSGFVRLDRAGFRIQVRLIHESLNDETPIFDADTLEYDPLEQLAREGDEEAI